jgi:hypothetical protein
MQPFELNKEAAEQQDAQNQYYGDDDDLDEAHNKLLKVEPGGELTKETKQPVF